MTSTAPAHATDPTAIYTSGLNQEMFDRDRILAAIDVGTNSIHMVVVKIQPELPTFMIVDREKETVRFRATFLTKRRHQKNLKVTQDGH